MTAIVWINLEAATEDNSVAAFAFTDDGRLAVPHEVELLKSTNLRTRADLVSHILATHFATHVGQLSTLRRLMGQPALF